MSYGLYTVGFDGCVSEDRRMDKPFVTHSWKSLRSRNFVIRLVGRPSECILHIATDSDGILKRLRSEGCISSLAAVGEEESSVEAGES